MFTRVAKLEVKPLSKAVGPPGLEPPGMAVTGGIVLAPACIYQYNGVGLSVLKEDEVERS